MKLLILFALSISLLACASESTPNYFLGKMSQVVAEDEQRNNDCIKYQIYDKYGKMSKNALKEYVHAKCSDLFKAVETDMAKNNAPTEEALNYMLIKIKQGYQDGAFRSIINGQLQTYSNLECSLDNSPEWCPKTPHHTISKKTSDACSSKNWLGCDQ